MTVTGVPFGRRAGCESSHIKTMVLRVKSFRTPASVASRLSLEYECCRSRTLACSCSRARVALNPQRIHDELGDEADAWNFYCSGLTISTTLSARFGISLQKSSDSFSLLHCSV